jgi:lipocalin
MARTPHISDADYVRLVIEARHLGYDIRKLRRVPHGEAQETARP